MARSTDPRSRMGPGASMRALYNGFRRRSSSWLMTLISARISRTR